MEYVNPIHKGNLLIPAVSKESWEQKYCILYKTKFGKGRVEIFDSRDLANQRPLRTIALQDFVEIIPRGTLFLIVTKKGVHEFDAITATSVDQWLHYLQLVVFPDDSSKKTSIEEYNDLYCPSVDGVFNVKLSSSPASLRCGLEAKPYVLVLSNNDVQLRNCDDNDLLFTWPYCFIRRYGYKNGKFSFEAGRKCASGEGTFFLEYPDQHTIFRYFAWKIKSMRKYLSNEIFPNNVRMEDSSQVTSNMQARSRSTLPPSPSTSIFVKDTEQNLSYKSQKINDSLTKKFNSILRPVPFKPPRKLIQGKGDSSKRLYGDAVNRYEEIEYRSDAWKTMGINDVNHTESEFAQPEEFYMSWGQVKINKDNVQNKISQMNYTPKVVNDPQNGEDYDKLNFFGPTSKLKNISTYRKVTISSKDLANSSSLNEYDEVEFEGVMKNKISNDIHTHTFSKKKGSHIDHQCYNNDPYAQINKQKRV